MAKKKYHRPKAGMKRYVKKFAQVSSSALIAGPVLVPALEGVTTLMAGGSSKLAVDKAIYSAVGYDPQLSGAGSGVFQASQLGPIITRDIVLVGGGLALRWASKKI